MTCFCGDIYCKSCGPAQGNNYCEICGEWADNGGCVDPEKCNKLAREAEQELYEDLMAEKEFWRET